MGIRQRVYLDCRILHSRIIHCHTLNNTIKEEFSIYTSTSYIRFHYITIIDFHYNLAYVIIPF